MNAHSPEFWINKEGKHPEPLRVIRLEDIADTPEEAVDGKWAPVNGGEAEELRKLVKVLTRFHNPFCIHYS